MPLRGLSLFPMLGLSAFLSHIVEIVLLCSRKKMFGIHTGRRVAVMANVLTVWNLANIQLVRHSMRQFERFGFVRPKNSVSVSCLVPNPEPAIKIRRCENLLMKSFAQIFPSSMRIAMSHPSLCVHLAKPVPGMSTLTIFDRARSIFTCWWYVTEIPLLNRKSICQ